MYDQVDETLDEEWAAAKGYLHYFAYGWDLVLRSVRLGRAADCSSAAAACSCWPTAMEIRSTPSTSPWPTSTSSLGIESPADIRAPSAASAPIQSRNMRLATIATEFRHRIRTGVLTDETAAPVLHGHLPIRRRRRARPSTASIDVISKILPFLIGLSSVWGWFMAGRALRPVNSVAQAAQEISGSNLSIRIPSRGAGDELDHLIATFNGMMDRLGSVLREDPPVLHRRLARTAHAADGDSRPARSGAAHRRRPRNSIARP